MSTTNQQRQHMAHLMDLLVAHEPKVHYKQARPMSTRTLKTEKALLAALASKAGVSMDCSESVTLICKLAGLTDPNGLHYNGLGFTGTLLHHLPHYSDPHAANVGGLVVFGPGTGDHVAMVRYVGQDPILWSHGSEHDPHLIRLSVERTYHRAPVTFLAITKLG